MYIGQILENKQWNLSTANILIGEHLYLGVNYFERKSLPTIVISVQSKPLYYTHYYSEPHFLWTDMPAVKRFRSAKSNMKSIYKLVAQQLIWQMFKSKKFSLSQHDLVFLLIHGPSTALFVLIFVPKDIHSHGLFTEN